VIILRRPATAVALILGAGPMLSIDGTWRDGFTHVPDAHARSIIKNLIARLRGETLPEGIVKSNGRVIFGG
jgi:HlyD family secretion protein